MKFIALDLGYIGLRELNKVGEIDGITSVKIYDIPPASNEEVVDRLKGAELVTSRVYVKFTREIIEQSKKLKAIFTQSVGYDYVDIEAAAEKGIKVFNCAGYNANAVAEYVFGLIMTLIRKIPYGLAHARSGGVEYRIFEGIELKNKKIGIVGFGNIGRRILEISRGFDMIPLVFTKHPSKNKAEQYGLDNFVSLKKIMSESDIIVIAVPLNSETKGLINKDLLKLMKKDAYLINTARQTVIDEYALAEAILKRKIAGAALDLILKDPFVVKDYPVLIQEFVNMPNVIVTPHIAAETHEANMNLSFVFRSNIKNFINGRFTNCVN
jgi:lactate dehydrogenase-like 2-hydroxyacid dehydrogenase